MMKVVVGGTVARIVGVEGAAEKEKAEKDGNKGERLVFFVNFALNFLLPQAMKSTSIYRRWKRAILSSRGKTFQPLI